MVKSFDKEAFMKKPVKITVEQVSPWDMDTPFTVTPPESTRMVIHVGNHDYDVRDLIWRLNWAEASIYDMMNYTHGLEDRIRQLEERIY